MLLSITPEPPELPNELNLPQPYILAVPRTVALSLNSLHLKSTLWPTVFAPRRRGEPEQWSRGKVEWALDAMEVVVAEASRARAKGEVSNSVFNLV
jgi:tRNA-specific adenosine deaminase 3